MCSFSMKATQTLRENKLVRIVPCMIVMSIRKHDRTDIDDHMTKCRKTTNMKTVRE